MNLPIRLYDQCDHYVVMDSKNDPLLSKWKDDKEGVELLKTIIKYCNEYPILTKRLSDKDIIIAQLQKENEDLVFSARTLNKHLERAIDYYIPDPEEFLSDEYSDEIGLAQGLYNKYDNK